MSAPVNEIRERVQAKVVGREREVTLVLAVVAAGRDLLLEGPPGTSKSTILRAITEEWGIPLVFVEGNADLTPAKLVGHHNPARVLAEDYSERGIVKLRAPLPDRDPALYDRLVADAVAVTRATRAHEDIRQGSSVRGAIDLTAVAGQLHVLARGGDPPQPPDARPVETQNTGHAERVFADSGEPAYRDLIYDAMIVSLSGRIHLDETVDATPEEVLRQIWEDHFFLRAAKPG